VNIESIAVNVESIAVKAEIITGKGGSGTANVESTVVNVMSTVVNGCSWVTNICPREATRRIAGQNIHSSMATIRFIAALCSAATLAFSASHQTKRALSNR
jgi:hypothetical protein